MSRIYSLFVILLTATLFSCQEKNTNHLVHLEDSLVNVITDYVESNHVDIKAKVISIRYFLGEERTDVYITNIHSEVYKDHNFTPYFYTVLENQTIVLIYTGFETVFSKNTSEIVNEITDLLVHYGVKLEASTTGFYYAPTWRYSQCSEFTFLNKKIDPLEYDFIPCEYRLIQDAIKTDSLFLIKTR